MLYEFRLPVILATNSQHNFFHFNWLPKSQAIFHSLISKIFSGEKRKLYNKTLCNSSLAEARKGFKNNRVVPTVQAKREGEKEKQCADAMKNKRLLTKKTELSENKKQNGRDLIFINGKVYDRHLDKMMSMGIGGNSLSLESYWHCWIESRQTIS